jgi:hypothetical protein
MTTNQRALIHVPAIPFIALGFVLGAVAWAVMFTWYGAVASFCWLDAQSDPESRS